MLVCGGVCTVFSDLCCDATTLCRGGSKLVMCSSRIIGNASVIGILIQSNDNPSVCVVDLLLLVS
jgi:hypothetical protein